MNIIQENSSGEDRTRDRLNSKRGREEGDIMEEEEERPVSRLRH